MAIIIAIIAVIISHCFTNICRYVKSNFVIVVIVTVVVFKDAILQCNLV